MPRSSVAKGLDRAIRKTSAQGVLYSHLVARRLGVASTDLECLDFIALQRDRRAAA